MQKIETMNLKFIIRKNRSVDGTMPIQMQITIDGERIFFSTGQKIEDVYKRQMYWFSLWHLTERNILE